ncbi:hypothetical protein L218DRAFT_69325 [Marasmius fiardii PR-910]|nr:hypothetical protein L218DRAFT_69325 [Marasmius fiardii PR-910]
MGSLSTLCSILPNPRTAWSTEMGCRYHQEWTTLIRPENSVSRRRVHNFSGSRVYSFTLTDTHGALLGLPMGSVLKNLERKTEFKERIKKYWRQWYEFSEQQVDLEEHQALYIVTGVEQCSTWAIAVWHHTPGDCSDPASLKLAINESDGSCSWVHSAVRCETQSLTTVELSEGVGALKQTVFVRGFWVNKVGASISGSASPSTPLRGSDGGLDGDDNSGGSGSSRGHWSSNPSTKSGFSQSGFGGAPAPGGGHSEDAALPTESADELQVQNISVDCLDLTSVSHP